MVRPRERDLELYIQVQVSLGYSLQYPWYESGSACMVLEN